MEYNVRINLLGTAFVLAAVLGVSMITSTVVVSRMVRSHTIDQTKARREIDMRGVAKKRVRADLAVWRVVVRSQGPSLEGAFDTLDMSSTAVREFLERQGFRPGEYTVGAISTRMLHARTKDGTELDEVTGYSLERIVTTSSSDVEKVALASNAITQLLRSGIQVASSSPEFTCTKLGELRLVLLGEAAKDAHARALEVVENSGGRVGQVRNVRANPIQVTEPDSTEMSGMGRYDTSTIEKDVTAVVNATFAIE